MEGRRERDLRVLDRGRRDGDVGACGLVRKRSSWNRNDTMVRSFRFSGSRFPVQVEGMVVGSADVGDGVGGVGPVVGTSW